MAEHPIGIAYPIQRGSKGMFEATYDSVSVAKNNIRNLMLTRPGERPGRPEYGSSFWTQVLFEQNEDVIEDIIEESLRGDIGRFLPEILVESIEVERSSTDIDIYRIIVRVNFRVSQNSEIETLSVNVEF